MTSEGRKKGIKVHTELSITKDDIITQFLQGDILWDKKKIIKRTKKIEEQVNQIWGNI